MRVSRETNTQEHASTPQQQQQRYVQQEQPVSPYLQTGGAVAQQDRTVSPYPQASGSVAQKGQPVTPSRSGGGAVAPSASAKSKTPLIIGIVAAVVVVAVVVVLFVVPRFTSKPADSGSSASTTPPASQSAASSEASSSTSSQAAASSTASASSASASSSAPATPSTSAASAASSPASAASLSTTERPTLADFQWLTGEAAKGNAPAGATRLTTVDSIQGSWKAYMFGSGMERFLNVDFKPSGNGAAVTFDWFYVYSGSAGNGQDDNTPDSPFNGSFTGAMFDATGSGRVTIAAFWELDGHQYATGSFIWPDGATDTIALVRP